MKSYLKDHEGINTEFYKNDFNEWDKEKEIEYNNNEIRQREKYRFFQQAYDYLSANFIEGDYYEFGCHKTRTFRMSLSEARKKNLVNINFYAFDSFEGLPEPGDIDKFTGWEKGSLKTTEDEFDAVIRQHGLYTDRIQKVKGYYQDSLNGELQQQLIKKESKIAIAYIDSDFYESAACALDFIEPLLQEGSIVCFDDWNVYKANPDKGERRAFREFAGNKGLHFEEFISVGWFGKSFILINREDK